jgi:ferric-dicitrate binding protein FerR (iron transport regulator)
VSAVQQPSDELARLLGALADESLTEEQQQRLVGFLLDDPAAREYYVRYVAMLSSLHWHCPALRPAPDRVRVRRKFPAHALAGGLTAVVLLLAALAAYHWTKPTPPSEPAVASLNAVGKVSVMRTGQAQEVTAPLPLLPGDSIRAEGAGLAIVSYPDGTRLELTGGSMNLTEAEGKAVVVHSGTLTARIAPQKADRPMTFLTPRAEVQALGTAFTLSADPRRTDLAVSSGRVRVSPVDGRGGVQVVEGQFVVAREGRELVARDVPRPPQRWGEDFEKGLPAGWLFGEFTAVGLPARSRGGVRASQVVRADGVYQEISTPKAWADGLFAIEADSVFHFTFRVQRAAWFQIFISTRPFDPEAPPTATYRYKDNALWSQDVGQWKTVSIPLSRFERVSDWSGVPPIGEVPFQVLFSSKDVDPGLVVDRVWVDRPR